MQCSFLMSCHDMGPHMSLCCAFVCLLLGLILTCRLLCLPQAYVESEGTQQVDFKDSVYKGQFVKPSDKERRWEAVAEAIRSLLLAKYGDRPGVTAATLNRDFSQ